MENASASFAIWSYGVAVLTYAVFSLSVGRTGFASQAGPTSRAIAAAVGFSCLWAASGLVLVIYDLKIIFIANLLADMARYAAWFAFMLLVLGNHVRSDRTDVKQLRAMTFIAAALVITGLAIQAAFAFGDMAMADWTSATWLHSLALTVFALFLLEQLVRNMASDSMWHIKPLAIGLAGAFLFDLYLASDAVLFKNIDADVFIARGFVHTAVAPLLWVSTARTKDWLAKVRLSQRAAFHSATLVLAGGYLIFMAAVGYYVRSFGGDWGRALAVAVVFVLLLGLGILLLSASTRARLRVLVGKHFFSYRYDYREEWLRFTHTLSNQDSSESMGQQVIRGLANLVESPAGSLWVKDPATREFAQMARWNMPVNAAREPAGSVTCRFIEGSGWVINMEEYRSYPGRYADLALPQWLSELPNAWLIVPLMVGNELIGFSVLASARTDLDVNWEVNDLLRTAGRQAASFLAQMQATEALMEVRKFDAFNRMSAFVVHDLKNIVTQLALLLKNAERHSDKPEFQKDMLMTIQHSVERMRQLMLQLREGATPPGTPVGVDLAGLIGRIADSKAKQGRSIEVRITDRLMTRGQEERIERVIGHIVQNALDATDQHGRVWVVLDRYGGQARIEVGDNGQGMSPDFIRERLFKPFQSTKQTGMGIGAYESAQYVRELGGQVIVDSEIDAGTRIVFLLPLFDIGVQSDLHPKEAA